MFINRHFLKLPDKRQFYINIDFLLLLNNSKHLKRTNNFLYQIGGISIWIRTDSPVEKDIFEARFEKFTASESGSRDLVIIDHHFSLPTLPDLDIGTKIYDTPPWVIYCNDDSWIYKGVVRDSQKTSIYKIGIFNQAHTIGRIYTEGEKVLNTPGWDSLTLFPSDQILLARLFADRQGCIFHAAGMIIDEQGFLFAGHSGAGKSTLATMLREHGEILCDDRIIVRRWPDGFKVHGTWSHGDVPDVSPNSAPLRAIFLLEQASHNRLVPVEDRKEIVRRLPFLIVKPLVTADWWEKTLDLVGQIAREVPVYRLQFDRSGRVIETIRSLL
jgi:hypothetical protein